MFRPSTMPRGYLLFVMFIVLTTGLCDISASAAVISYSCSPFHTATEFPACLYRPTVCPLGQKCSIKYMDGNPFVSVIGCTTACSTSSVRSTDCKYGGSKLSSGDCLQCCGNDACVAKTTTSLALEFYQSSSLLFCPGTCKPDDLNTCMATGAKCLSNEFCALSFNQLENRLRGNCIGKNYLLPCQNLSTCPVPAYKLRDYFVHFPAKLQTRTIGCCMDNWCVYAQFHHFIPYNYMQINTTLSSSTTTATAASTIPTSTLKSTSRVTSSQAFQAQPSSVSPRAVLTAKTTGSPTQQSKGASSPHQNVTISTRVLDMLLHNCSDQLEGVACSVLQDSEGVCSNDLAVAICPDTCGICLTLQRLNCHDTILNNGCADRFKAEINFCQRDAAKTFCPMTCGQCASQAKKVVNDIISGKLVVTFQPPTLSTSSSPPGTT